MTQPIPPEVVDPLLADLESVGSILGDIRTVEDVTAAIKTLEAVRVVLAQVGAYADTSKLPGELEPGDRIAMPDGIARYVLIGTWPGSDPYVLNVPFSHDGTSGGVDGIFQLDLRLPVPVEVA